MAQPTAIAEKKELVSNPLLDKAASSVVANEKKEDVASIPPEKKVQPKINPWTRKVEFVPSNLVPQNLPKATINPEVK